MPLKPTASKIWPSRFPELTMAAVGNTLKFNIRIEFGGETTPDPEAVEKINELLAEVSDKLKLN